MGVSATESKDDGAGLSGLPMQGVPEMARGAQNKLNNEEQFKTKNKRCNKHTTFI